MSVKFLIVGLFVVLAVGSLTVWSFAASPAPMMGAAPAVEAKKPPAKPGKEASEPVSATTPADYKLYAKLGDRNAKWDEFIAPAFTSFDQGQFATAGILLKKAYELGCRDPLVLFRLGIYYESTGEFDQAATLFDEAVEGVVKRYPGHPLAKAMPKHAGRALYKADRMDEALPHLKKALAVEPDDFMLLLMAGQIERIQGNLTEARGYFERALAAGPPQGVTPDPKLALLRELIILTYELKDWDACRRYADSALKIDPRDKVANEYRKDLSRARQRQKELEIIKKLVE